MQKYKRAGMFTDIHFGRKNNSELHNQDCKDFIYWFKDQCVKYDVDHIVFLGDWFEERTAIDSLTQTVALQCAKVLNSIGVPVYFIVGNHDLYYRDNREIFASYVYTTLENFVIINEPTISEETLAPTLYSPFLFEPEYAELSQYFDVPVWMGHFEFKGFVLTGDTVVKDSGPDPDQFSAPEKIFSGHFHKRQHSKNVHYIGNAFPMDFGDANDDARGMAIYDYESADVQYINWEDCPKYMRVNLSDINDDPDILNTNARVKCIADTDITFSENSELKQKMIEDYDLREFTIEEVMTITVTESDLTEEDMRVESTGNLVRIMLTNIDSDTIDNERLIKEYDTL